MEMTLLSMLLLKHLIADYYLQVTFKFRDKHIYGSWGGVSHAGNHGILTALCLLPFVESAEWAILFTAWMYGMLDFALHYHIDYVKANYSKRYPSLPTERKYWIVLGIDQLAHVLTYILIVYLLFAEQVI